MTLGSEMNFIRYNTKSMIHERKRTLEFDLIKTRNFCSAKGIVKRMKDKSQVVKFLPKYISDKGLYLRYTKRTL